MPASFLIWRNRYAEGHCVVTTPRGVADDYQLSRGVTRAADWPEGVTSAMNEDYPKDIELADNLYGTNLIIVSGRLRNLVLADGVVGVEFLPVTILNHKNRIASADYFIVNPVGVVDCIDLEASEVKFNLIKKDLISRCKGIVLREAEIPSEAKVFRAKYLPTKILIRSDLARRLEDAGLTGLRFTDPAEFTGA
jgi:hypothetical protein